MKQVIYAGIKIFARNIFSCRKHGKNKSRQSHRHYLGLTFSPIVWPVLGLSSGLQLWNRQKSKFSLHGMCGNSELPRVMETTWLVLAATLHSRATDLCIFNTQTMQSTWGHHPFYSEAVVLNESSGLISKICFPLICILLLCEHNSHASLEWPKFPCEVLICFLFFLMNMVSFWLYDLGVHRVYMGMSYSFSVWSLLVTLLVTNMELSSYEMWYRHRI